MELNHSLRLITPTLDADVLSVLAGADASFTSGQIHRVMGHRSLAGIQVALARLVDQGIVSCRPAGRANLYELNRRHLAAKYIVALARLDAEFLTSTQRLVQMWAVQPIHVVLFGSAARGTMRPDSDIDLFVVRPLAVDQDSATWEDQIRQLESEATAWTGNDARVFELDEDQLRAALERGDETVANIANEGVWIVGERYSLLVTVSAS